MTKDEWMQLPTATRLEVLFDVLHDRLVTHPVPASSAQVTLTTTAGTPAPAAQREPTRSFPTRPPKYDAKLARRGGFVFMSEMLLADLEWWLAKKRESVEAGGQYAEKDRKTVAELERWIAWRRSCPGDGWLGIRGDREVTASAPTRDPELHAWPSRGPQRLETQPADYNPPTGGGFDDRDYGASGDDCPF